MGGVGWGDGGGMEVQEGVGVKGSEMPQSLLQFFCYLFLLFSRSACPAADGSVPPFPPSRLAPAQLAHFHSASAIERRLWEGEGGGRLTAV